MTMVVSALGGMCQNTGVSHSRVNSIRTAFTKPASPGYRCSC